MVLKSITSGSISGTGTLDLNRGLLGAIIVSLDGTNAGTVTIRKTVSGEANGEIIFQLSAVKSLPALPVFPIVAGDKIYYSISGTGCSCQIYEAIP